MKVWNPELSAVNGMKHQAEEAGVLLKYLAEDIAAEYLLSRPLSIQERRELVKKLVAEKEKKE